MYIYMYPASILLQKNHAHDHYTFSELRIKTCYTVYERVKKNCAGTTGPLTPSKVKWSTAKFVAYAIFYVDSVTFLP